MLKAWFFLTVAYVIGFAIYVLFAVVYGLISEGRLPDFTIRPDKEGFFAILFIWVITYVPSLFMFWYLPSRSFFRKAILSHMLPTTIWFLIFLVQMGSFLDSLLFTGLLLGVPFVLGLVIANWLTHSIIAGLSQFKRKAMVRVKPPKTLDFADYGKRVVVGQDYAIDTIQKVLIANTKLADRGDPRRNRILTSFLFVGPTGVGKTETAKALAS